MRIVVLLLVFPYANSSMISCGMDMGLRKSGIVLLDDDFEIVSQNLIRTDKDVRGAERLVQIEKGFDTIIKPLKKQKLEFFIEGYAYGAKYQRESLAELGGIIRRYLYLNKFRFWIIPPTSLKLFVTGTSRASKNYMKKCTKERWDQSFKSDDVCDAYGMSQLGMNLMKVSRYLQGISHLESYQQHVITDVIENKDFYNNTAKKKKNVKRTRKSTSQRSD